MTMAFIYGVASAILFGAAGYVIAMNLYERRLSEVINESNSSRVRLISDTRKLIERSAVSSPMSRANVQELAQAIIKQHGYLDIHRFAASVEGYHGIKWIGEPFPNTQE